jgi:hypothetical protein
MTRRYLKFAWWEASSPLAPAHSKRSPPDETEREHAEYGMDKLNKETVKITQQNALNAKSTSGVYLLPGANTPPG